MGMELLQLRYFYETANSQSITKTAQRHLVPSSSVSWAIKRLEQELGCTLFDRTGNRVKLNSRGQVLRDAAAVALESLDRAVEQLTSQEEEPNTDIYLLVRSERQVLLDCVSAFRQRHPHVAFHLSHDFDHQQPENFDIIIDASTAEYPGFLSVPLVREDIRIAAAQDHPLCGRPVQLRDLQREPFLTLHKESSMAAITVDRCRRAGFSPNIVLECDDPQYLRRYIALGFGLAFVPERSWRGQMEGTRYLQVTDLREQRITCAHLNKNRKRTPLLEEFFALLIEQRQME